ncbi:MAG: hypothetical protein B6242_05595 [Anaerolineaceae bacterium 4572_78]|nr:MAG: hypothetical protein B6242_05595 [Anaerolineaceae bacterium 4572_78]
MQIDDDMIIMPDDDNFILPDDEAIVYSNDDSTPNQAWKILIVDDEKEIHNITGMALKKIMFKKKTIKLYSAYSGEEAKSFIEEHPDTALILLDVVMETDDAGLQVIKYVRKILKNQLVRIILRTGQPGQAPESQIIVSYDINDYKSKTELTKIKLFTTVIAALRTFDLLNTIETQRQASTRFVPNKYLEFLRRDSIVDIKLGDHVAKEMAIMVSDIRSFTTLSEMMTSKENFDFINDYLKHVSPIIRKYNGFVIKYLGDGMMAAFPNGVNDAVQAGIAKLKAVENYNQHFLKENWRPINIGIGVHVGNMMFGMVGEKNRMQGDAFSDNVNLTARIEGLTKYYGVSMIISEQTYYQLDSNDVHIRFLDMVVVKGRKIPVMLYEVMDGLPAIEMNLKIQTQACFESGIEWYRKQHFQKSKECFEKVLMINPNDKVVHLYIDRMNDLLKHGIPEGWDGVVWLMESKVEFWTSRH